MLKELLISSLSALITVYTLLLLLLVLIFIWYRIRQMKRRVQFNEQTIVESTDQKLLQLRAQYDKLLMENEWLLKEIHHRVRNNLQIVISLLNAQSDFLDHPSALEAIRESRERIQAIALIQQKLYQQETNALIDMTSYIQELIDYLQLNLSDPPKPGYQGSVIAGTSKVTFVLDIDDIRLDPSQAVSLGLLLNEAINNAAKHAFSPGDIGILTIALHNAGSSNILLKLTSHGKSPTSTTDPSLSGSLAIQLMKLFAEQLEGEINFQGRGGAEISLSFKQ